MATPRNTITYTHTFTVCHCEADSRGSHVVTLEELQRHMDRCQRDALNPDHYLSVNEAKTRARAAEAAPGIGLKEKIQKEWTPTTSVAGDDTRNPTPVPTPAPAIAVDSSYGGEAERREQLVQSKVEELENELTQLRETNRAMSLYISGIVERILQHKDSEANIDENPPKESLEDHSESTRNESRSKDTKLRPLTLVMEQEKYMREKRGTRDPSYETSWRSQSGPKKYPSNWYNPNTST